MAKDFVFVVFSNYKYKEHKYNILKECLQSWISNENYKFAPQDIEIIDICIIQVTNSARIVINFYSNKLLLTFDKQGEIINNKHALIN